MRHRILGRSGVKVPELCFGTMAFGGDADEATSAALLARCRDAGLHFLDPAASRRIGRKAWRGSATPPGAGGPPGARTR